VYRSRPGLLIQWVEKTLDRSVPATLAQLHVAVIDKGAVASGEVGTFSVGRANYESSENAQRRMGESVTVQAHSVAQGTRREGAYRWALGGCARRKACARQPQSGANSQR